MNGTAAVRTFADFARRQAIAASFAFALIFGMAVTSYVQVPWLPRYDVLLLWCLLVQAWMLRRGLENWRDIGVISIFHVVGVLLEWTKVRAGSWSYPEPAFTKAFGVPLYSGFMYAAVASYMSLAWRTLGLEFHRWPSKATTVAVLAAVYGQFFMPIQTLAVRFLVLAAVLIAFWRCYVAFDSGGRRWHMPAGLAFGLIGFHVWLAENIATYFGAWVYPNQADGWAPVHIAKVVSWTLLMIVSLTVVFVYKTRFAPPVAPDNQRLATNPPEQLRV